MYDNQNKFSSFGFVISIMTFSLNILLAWI